ncbi:MAG: hypothetical protein DCF27_08585 [Lysobacteraceae bacterium]|nr:MAG: hypothetical protein DCF27_08585 [Xanthomonadaceae bacterium]
MNRAAIFVAGALSGALALGLVLVGWDTQVAVAPAPSPAAVVQPVPAVATQPGLAVEASPPADLPAPVARRAGPETPSLPPPAVVAVPPSQPELAELPVDAAAPPTSEAPLPALSLIVPVEGIVAAQLSDTFTDARGEGRVHDAIDIMAPTGTPVLAVAGGRIVKLFNSKPGGLTIYQFDATEAVAFYYAHLDRYADGVAEGQAVKQGDLIGYVGFTGNASPDGPHLHFAIMVLGPEKNWWQGAAINPFPYLRAAPPR